MRREYGLLFFESKQEEDKEIKKGFQGILVRRHPDSFMYAEIIEIISKESIQRPIGIMDIFNYCEFGTKAEKATQMFKKKVIQIVCENYLPAIELGIPEIVISAELEDEFFYSK